MKGGRFSPGQAYVAFSHVRTMDELQMLNINAKAIKKSTDVENKMVRLSTNLLQPVPEVVCDLLQ